MNGKPLDVSSFDANKFWKNEMINAFRILEPNFELSDRNRQLIADLYKWAWRSKESQFDTNKGLLFWGGVGVGKSLLLRGIRNYEAKINQYCFGYNNESLGFQMVSAAEISLQYASKGMDAIEQYAKNNLAIDEVGREPFDAKHYGTNINPVQLVLQLRYDNRHNALTHMTTNLNPDKYFHIYGDYIVDRIKEMFNVIHVGGESRR